MQEINAQNLESVAGGTKKSDQVTQSLTQIQTTLRGLANNNNNTSSSTMLMFALAMQNRTQTVVAAPGCTFGGGSTSFFRFRARFRF